MTKGSTSKRVRFSGNSNATREFSLNTGSYSSADEYDSDFNADLEADITSSRRRGHKVNIDGYGSDASDQDEVANLSDYSDDQDEAGVGGDDDDDDDEQVNDSSKLDPLAMDENDMFTDNAESSVQQAEKKRKRFLELDDIEGQEMNSATRTEAMGEDFAVSKGKEPERDMVDDDDDEEPAGRGRITIEAFNMKEDLEEGKFDASGNFVWNKQDPHAYQDEWLDDVSESAIALAFESKARQDSGSLRTQAGEEGRWDAASDNDIVVEIINVLRPRETVLTALARIGGPKQKSKNKWASKRGKAKDAAAAGLDGEKEAERKRDIEHLTVLADQAMSRGMVNIYDDTYEQLVRQMRVADRIPDDWIVGTPLQPSAARANSANVVSELLEDLDEL
ncbi:hypothetical protein GGI20_004818 [Coemansia sp. BCRC 34301]|nr:hypothetical protein GGI20_004818 [Coemansia sp. BCRC 34301]